MQPPAHYRWQQHDLLLELRIAPRAGRDRIGGVMGSRLKVQITAPPVDGKANAHLIRFLAAQFGVPSSDVDITRGHHSRDKTVRIRQPRQIPPACCLLPPEATA